MSPEFKSLEELTALSLLASETEGDQGGIIGLRIGPYNAALFRRRQELGLSQKQLAEKVGLKTANSISQFETLRAFPKPELVAKLTEILGVNPFPEWLQLFTRDSKQPAQIRIELTDSEVSRPLLDRAYELETALTAIDPQAESEAVELREKLYDALGGLAQKERRVIISRFGLEGEALTLEETGKEFDLSEERIRQIEAKSLRKLRHPSTGKELRGLTDEKSGDLRSPEALINGAINAFHQGDHERADGNLEEVEKQILLRESETTVRIINAASKYQDSYKWDEEVIKSFTQWYMKKEGITEFRPMYLVIGETINTIYRLREVWKLRSKMQKN